MFAIILERDVNYKTLGIIHKSIFTSSASKVYWGKLAVMARRFFEIEIFLNL